MSDAARSFADEIRTHDRTAFLATLFAPEAARPALLALAAYRIELRRIVERARDPLAAEIRLQWWRDALTGAGEAGGVPIAVALQEAAARCRWPAETLAAISEAHIYDLYADTGHWPTMHATAQRVATEIGATYTAARQAVSAHVQGAYHAVQTVILVPLGEAVSEGDDDVWRLIPLDQDVPRLAFTRGLDDEYRSMVENWRSELLEGWDRERASPSERVRPTTRKPDALSSSPAERVPHR